MAVRLLLIALALLVPAGAALGDVPTGVPDALSPQPLERAALVAMPAVWRVEASTTMTGIRTKGDP